jgi:hypothetical protein
MKISVSLPSIHRPHEYRTFLEQHFIDAVLDYCGDPVAVANSLYKDKWESRRIQRKGKDAIKRYITEKEKSRLVVEWNFE